MKREQQFSEMPPEIKTGSHAGRPIGPPQRCPGGGTGEGGAVAQTDSA